MWCVSFKEYLMNLFWIAHWQTYRLNSFVFNPLSVIPTKWSNTFKQFVGSSRRIVWVFDHFVGLALKGLKKVCLILLWKYSGVSLISILSLSKYRTSQLAQLLFACLTSTTWKVRLNFFSEVTNETKYSRMDQIKFVKKAFKKIEVIWFAETGDITSYFLKAVFYKFYLVHSCIRFPKWYSSNSFEIMRILRDWPKSLPAIFLLGKSQSTVNSSYLRSPWLPVLKSCNLAQVKQYRGTSQK